jgi:hypothetical protein
LLFITPVTPAEAGNGLAMRAGLFLEALGQAYDTTLLVVPTSGPAPRVWSEFITARTTRRLAVCLDDAYGSPDTGDPAAPRDLAAGSRRRQAVTLRARGPLAWASLAALPGVSGWEARPDGGTFETENAAATLAGLAPLLAAPGVELLELQVRRASLEEVFLQLTREEHR